MNDFVLDTTELLSRAGTGDERARQQLFQRFRGRLRRMIAVRLDPRLAARLDPSDIVQEALADAAGKLDDYLAKRPLPFYPWLHRLAAERLAQAHRHHLRCQKRAVGCEVQTPADASTARLADRFAATESSPSERFSRWERRRQVLEALDQLSKVDREVLVMRYLEGLRFREIAEVFGLTEGAVKVRHFRALRRIQDRLGNDNDIEGPSR